MDCSHMMVSMMGDRTICLLCKADLKRNKATKKYVVISKPDKPEFHDKFADHLREGMLKLDELTKEAYALIDEANADLDKKEQIIQQLEALAKGE
jgi:heme oxygenase